MIPKFPPPPTLPVLSAKKAPVPSSTPITPSLLSTAPHALARPRALNPRLFTRPAMNAAKRVPQHGRRIAICALLHHHVGDHRPLFFVQLGSDLRFGRYEMFLLNQRQWGPAFRNK